MNAEMMLAVAVLVLIGGAFVAGRIIRLLHRRR